jgi:Holliday junction resolvasome RuvABC DNA-binding subunit
MKKVISFCFIFLAFFATNLFSAQDLSKDKNYWRKKLLDSIENAEKKNISIERSYKRQCNIDKDDPVELNNCIRKSQRMASDIATEEGRATFVENLNQKAIENLGYVKDDLIKHVNIHITKKEDLNSGEALSFQDGHHYYECQIRVELTGIVSTDFKRELSITDTENRKRESDNNNEDEDEGSTCDVRNVKNILKMLGYYFGEVNDKLDEQTKMAIKNFQNNNNLQVNGELDEKTCKAILKQL